MKVDNVKETNTESENTNLFLKLTILFIGMYCQTTWNTILSSLDFYHDKVKLKFLWKKFPEKNPSFVFPLLKGSFFVIFQTIFFFKQKFFTVKTRIIMIIIGNILITILLPLSVSMLPAGQGYFVACTLVSILGIADAGIFMNIYLVICFLPKEFLVYKNAGIGFSGINMNILRYFTILISSSLDGNKNQDKFFEIFIFYGISIIFGIIVLIFLILLYKNKTFLMYQKYFNEKQNHKLIDGKII